MSQSDTALDPADTYLFGWDPTPGIVSVWAARDGRAVVWRRVNETVHCDATLYRPWLLAATLDDVQASGLLLEAAPAADAALSYRELDGPDRAYRFVIEARSGVDLERAVLRGASRRLHRQVYSLSELGDAYVRVGPIEQYLMQTGRVYFRGLRWEDVHRLQFDLETTALDPTRGRIFMAALRDTAGLATTLEARDPADETSLIEALCDLIRDRNPDVIENHNLFGFDLPFLEARASALGVALRLQRDGPRGVRLPSISHYPDPHGRGPLARRRRRVTIPGRELIDTLDAVRRYDFAVRDLPSHRLKDVARAFGVAAPDRQYVAGAEVYATFASDPQRVRRYALDDVAEVDALSQRLLGAAFALTGMAPRSFERVASAGPAMGILEPLLLRAYLLHGAAVPRSTPDDGTLHAGGALHLFASGIAQHVVKADVASLYPSLMRTYRIGPAADRLGALLAIVGRLTDLRLAHKAAARAAAAHSLEAARNDASQAAMKILINSAYGYLGAGEMALFADRAAADEVTQRGREVLDQVVGGLRERGMALIEADTDGVYFAVPPGWLEADERALVAEVAATLPAGIRLEYEGRYAAMFSHEVKNYALLSYEGTLVRRGIALRSSRSEPYGERFLEAALRCTLQGDIAGVRNLFLQTVAALRERSLPASDVASRMRLSKSPEAYQESAARHREIQYEALLAAGQHSWQTGKRVRVYRAMGGRAVWLPDESDELGDSTEAQSSASVSDGRAVPDYDAEYYVQQLINTYAARLRKAFAPEHFAQLFRLDEQLGLFDTAIDEIEPIWIRCADKIPPASKAQA